MTKRDNDKYREILAQANGDEKVASRLYLKWKCLTDLYFLGTEVLGLRSAKEGKRSRLDPKFHGWMAGKLNKNKDLLMLVPRDHMKSTWMKIKIIQLILQKPNIRIGLFSRTSGLVEGQLSEIKNHFMNPTLMQLFPEIIPPPGKRYSGWTRSTANELTLSRSDRWGRIPQENQIEAWGAQATVTGRHYDVIIMDDIINEQSCSTPEQIQKVRDWYSYIQSIKEPHGFELIIGTRYHFNDIYGTIIENKYIKEVYTRQAIEDGKPIYSYMTLEYLRQLKRRVGSYIFSCQYMNDPLPGENKIFTRPFPVFDYLPPGAYDFYITVDPAATTGSQSDETAIVVGAVDAKNTLYIVDCKGYKIPPNEVADKIIELTARYKPKKVGVEFGLQEALRYIIQIKKDEWEVKEGKQLPLKLESIVADRDKSKADRINRTLGSFVRESKVYFQKDLEALFKQMDFFPKAKHDDLVDATSMQLQLIDRFRPRYWEEGLRQMKKTHTFFDIFAKKSEDGWEQRFVS